MFTIESIVDVGGLTAREVYEFLTNPTDAAYQQWWPGTHLQFHMVRRRSGLAGSTVFMDEYVGTRRIRMGGVIRAARPERLIEWQFRSIVRLPIRLRLELTDTVDGVQIRHAILVGLRGAGSLLDRLFRRFLGEKFAEMMDEHVQTEFPMLRDLLHATDIPGQAGHVGQ